MGTQKQIRWEKSTKASSNQVEMQSIGFFGLFKESIKTIFSWKKIFSRITLTFILPLSFILLNHMIIADFFYRRIERYKYREHIGHYLSHKQSSAWTTYCVFMVVYVTSLFVFSLLSTAAIVYTIATVYKTDNDKDVTFKKVVKIVPKVWKRLTLTFFWIYIGFTAYNIMALVVVSIWVKTVSATSFGYILFWLLLFVYCIGFVYITAVWQLASVVAVFERLYGLKAMMKGNDLIKGKRFLSWFVFLVLYCILVSIVMFYVLNWNYSVFTLIIGLMCLILLMILFLVGYVAQTMLYLICKSHHREPIDKIGLSSKLEGYLGELEPAIETHEDIELKGRDLKYTYLDIGDKTIRNGGRQGIGKLLLPIGIGGNTAEIGMVVVELVRARSAIYYSVSTRVSGSELGQSLNHQSEGWSDLNVSSRAQSELELVVRARSELILLTVDDQILFSVGLVRHLSFCNRSSGVFLVGARPLTGHIDDYGDFHDYINRGDDLQYRENIHFEPCIDMQNLGFFGLFKESLKTIFLWKKIFSRITLTFILPLSFIFINDINIGGIVDQHIQSYEYRESNDHPKSSFWIAYFVYKLIYLISILIVSLLSTTGIVYTVATMYTDDNEDVTFKKVLKIVPRVWKRVTLTFFWIYIGLIVYNKAFKVVVALIWAYAHLYDTTFGLIFYRILYFVYFIVFIYIIAVSQLAGVVAVLERFYGLKATRKSNDLIKGKRWLSWFVFLVLDCILVGILSFYLFIWNYSFFTLLVGLVCLVLLMIFLLVGYVAQTMLYLICKSHHCEPIDKIGLLSQLGGYLGELEPTTNTNKDVELGQLIASSTKSHPRARYGTIDSRGNSGRWPIVVVDNVEMVVVIVLSTGNVGCRGCRGGGGQYGGNRGRD
ncbi:hypothetical protein OSB04_005282 [Centaurea solstitialis]|uniref:Uncharacterized protein n=1 Tax=Centaurea solstitialis TaxID=347529 RepID=A0AA38WGA7_9ASTR|nr:hypothetical protein OSB04_005282 [Centaurea solstitialis]